MPLIEMTDNNLTPDDFPDLPYIDFCVCLLPEGDLEPEIIDIPFTSCWWEYECDSWDYSLNSQWLYDKGPDGIEYNVKWQDWALREGIAPGQAFWLRMSRPTYSRDYWGEVDCDYDLEIIHIVPMPMHEAAKRWYEFFDEQKKWRAEAEKAHKEMKERQLSDVSAMYTQTLYYGRYGEEPCVQLCTKHRWTGYFNLNPVLASGSNKDRKREEAFKRMLEDAAQRLPHLTEEVIRALPHERCF